MVVDTSGVSPSARDPLDAIREALEPVRAPRFLDLNLPRTGWGWAGVVAPLLIIVVFPHPLVVYIVGALMAYCCPTGIELAIAKVRESVGSCATVTYEQGPNGELTEPSKGTHSEGWFVVPPQIDAWHVERPYDPDPSGLLAEHPVNVGTPVAAMFTLRSLLRVAQSAFLAFFAWWVFSTTGSPDWLYICLAGGQLLLVSRWLKVRKWRALSDLPTSTVRSAAVGKVEVFGQLRPRTTWPLPVAVDNDPRKLGHGLGAWTWRYGHLFEWEEWVEERDEEGNVTGGRWDNRSAYTFIRGAEGSWPTLLHDGTGGIALNANLLDHPPRVNDWRSADHSLWSTRGRPSGKVRNTRAYHSWDLNGWAMGEPLFASCYAVPRSNEELQAESVDISTASANIELTREGSAIGHAVTVHRGTELLAMQEMESSIGAMLPSSILVCVSLFTLITNGVWF